jgi:hypothetical protein
VGGSPSAQTSSSSPVAPAYYVSPNGSDSSDGLSPSTPFLTPEKARAAMEASSVKTAYLMGGTYMRTVPLALGIKDSGEAWLAYPGQTPILDGGNTVQMAISVRGNNITIRWLTIQNFAQSGIVAQNVSGVLIDSNTVLNIHSTGFNQGGIISLNNFTDGKMTHNFVQNTGWVGIAAGTSTVDSINNLVIDSNIIYDTCTVVADCGAIYADDRGHASTGIFISNNIAGNYGTTSNGSKAIYLDDQLSNATVENNIVYGTGSYAFQIHGGDHNVFKNNIFDISKAKTLGLYQDDGTTAPNYGMNGNEFTCNITYSSINPPPSLWAYEVQPSDAAPHVSNNLYWDESGVLPHSGIVADILPTVSNPGFVNPGQANYSFRSRAPSFCNFVPINASQVGPLPNS